MTAYAYEALVLYPHDGDTLKLCVDLGQSMRGKDRDLGFHIYVESGRLKKHDSFRLLGLNAPELATPAGKDALAYVKEWLVDECDVVSHLDADGTRTDTYAVHITTVKDAQEKYGRFLARLYGRGDPGVRRCLNDDLITTNHALPWDGKGVRPVAQENP